MKSGDLVMIGVRVFDSHNKQKDGEFHWSCQQTTFSVYTYEGFYKTFKPKNWEPVWAVVK